MEDQLVAHYRMVVHLIQTMLLRRVPRLMRSAATGLTEAEMQDIAQLLAKAHQVARPHEPLDNALAQHGT